MTSSETIDGTVGNILDELKTIKGPDYVSSLVERMGQDDLNKFVHDMKRQLIRVLGDDEKGRRWTIEALANLDEKLDTGESVFERIANHRSKILRGVIETTSDYDIGIALWRMFASYVPPNLRLSMKDSTVKLGFDPTNSALHLGHLVTIKKMLDFKELGYKVTPILGTFTALIGDPSGRSDGRTPLSRDQVMSYTRQIEGQLAGFFGEGKIGQYTRKLEDVLALFLGEGIIVDYVRRLRAYLPLLTGQGVRFYYNHEWLSNMPLQEYMKIANNVRLGALEDRPELRERREGGEQVTVGQFLYPMKQGLDSAKLRTSFEIGGQDQLRNMMFGREVQRAENLEDQIGIAMPLLTSLDGVHKMSKSNPATCVFLNRGAADMYGKIMSIPDYLMEQYAKLLTRISTDKIDAVKSQIGEYNLLVQQGLRFARHYKIGELIASRGQFLEISDEEVRKQKGRILLYLPNKDYIASKIRDALEDRDYLVKIAKTPEDLQRELTTRDYKTIIMDLSSEKNYSEDLNFVRETKLNQISVIGIKGENSLLDNGLESELLGKYRVQQRFEIVNGEIDVSRVTDSVKAYMPRGEGSIRSAIEKLEPFFWQIEKTLRQYVMEPDYSIIIGRKGNKNFEIKWHDDATKKAIEELKKIQSINDYGPIDLKHEIAYSIVSMIYGEDAARAARKEFELKYQERGLGELPIYQIPELIATKSGKINVRKDGVTVEQLARLILPQSYSNTYIRILAKEGAIRIRSNGDTDWQKISDLGQTIDLSLQTYIRFGKHFQYELKLIKS